MVFYYTLRFSNLLYPTLYATASLLYSSTLLYSLACAALFLSLPYLTLYSVQRSCTPPPLFYLIHTWLYSSLCSALLYCAVPYSALLQSPSLCPSLLCSAFSKIPQPRDSHQKLPSIQCCLMMSKAKYLLEENWNRINMNQHLDFLFWPGVWPLSHTLALLNFCRLYPGVGFWFLDFFCVICSFTSVWAQKI